MWASQRSTRWDARFVEQQMLGYARPAQADPTSADAVSRPAPEPPVSELGFVVPRWVSRFCRASEAGNPGAGEVPCARRTRPTSASIALCPRSSAGKLEVPDIQQRERNLMIGVALRTMRSCLEDFSDRARGLHTEAQKQRSRLTQIWEISDHAPLETPPLCAGAFVVSGRGVSL